MNPGGIEKREYEKWDHYTSRGWPGAGVPDHARAEWAE
jgi:hypothetical protein